MRFIGLGQLPPEALHLLWAERVPVADEALAAGRAAWDALRAPDPTALAALAARGTAGIPQLGAAMRRHLRELPGTRDGLGLSQRMTLGLLAEGTRTVAGVFGALMMEREPLPWMTDLIFHDVLKDLRGGTPVIASAAEGHDGPWARRCCPSPRSVVPCWPGRWTGCHSLLSRDGWVACRFLVPRPAGGGTRQVRM